MSQVLFVDDDTNILNGLRRRLHRMRPQWQMQFASNGAEALDKVADTAFDVVVSDMRMPGMDGSALLEKVRNLRPEATRIILSGFAEDEAILRTVGPAHQYLAKPCEENLLVETIEHALELRNLLGSAKIRSLVSGLESLASPPTTYTRLVEALDDPRAGSDRITAIVSADIALTAEVLKLTNSSYFSLPGKISSVSHAVRMIGMDTLKALALLVGLFKGFDGPPKVIAHLTRLSHRSQQIGICAALIAEYEGLSRQICQTLPSTGMLSHVGSLVLYVSCLADMEKVIDRVERDGISITEAETEQFGAAHPEIGAYLLGLWGFPGPVVQAVAYHHRPMDVPEREMSPLVAIYAAQQLTREVANGCTDPDSPTDLDMAFLERIGKAGHVEEWRKIAMTVDEKYKAFAQ